jgi:hypothetical protein
MVAAGGGVILVNQVDCDHRLLLDIVLDQIALVGIVVSWFQRLFAERGCQPVVIKKDCQLREALPEVYNRHREFAIVHFIAAWAVILLNSPRVAHHDATCLRIIAKYGVSVTGDQSIEAIALLIVSLVLFSDVTGRCHHVVRLVCAFNQVSEVRYFHLKRLVALDRHTCEAPQSDSFDATVELEVVLHELGPTFFEDWKPPGATD